MKNTLKAALFAAALGLASTSAMAADAPKAAYSTADSTIGVLLERPETKAVLEKHLPELVANPQIDMAKARTIRSIVEFMPDLLTPEKLAAVDADLAKVPAK